MNGTALVSTLKAVLDAFNAHDLDRGDDCADTPRALQSRARDREIARVVYDVYSVGISLSQNVECRRPAE